VFEKLKENLIGMVWHMMGWWPSADPFDAQSLFAQLWSRVKFASLCSTSLTKVWLLFSTTKKSKVWL
jgi:hypothetical protein